MPIDALPNDLDALRALVSQLSSERDVAIAESRRLTEQNDQLRHLLKQLQRAQFGQRSERLDRDQMQLALEDIETSLANRDVEEEEEEEEQQNGATDKPADARSGASTVARCRRIFPAFMSRSNPRARFAMLQWHDACLWGREFAAPRQDSGPVPGDRNASAQVWLPRL
jgi:hypothetical protein